MEIVQLPLAGALLLKPKVFFDSRGFFVERFQLDRFKSLGLPYQFVQDNHSRSAPGVLRGLHFQTQPSQGKLVGVIRGTVRDVILDLRKGSPSYGRSICVELTGESSETLWVPSGFAHGFIAIGSEPADVIYKVDAPYSPKTESGIFWSDPLIREHWGIDNPMVSDKDQKLPSFEEYDRNPAFTFLEGND